MNEEVKLELKTQPKHVYNATLRYRDAKTALETFDAASRNTIKADGMKRTEADTDALVLVAEGRAAAARAFALAEAEMNATEAKTKCLLAEASLVSAETAAMSRISL